LLNGQYLASAFPLDRAGLTLRQQEESTWLYENELSLPRTYVVHQTEPATKAQVWEELEAFDPTRMALVEGGHSLRNAAKPSPARIVKQTANRLIVKTELEAPGLLVLGEIWYPGWQARDNGRQMPILRTNAILRGIYLDAGTHTIELVYDPWTVRAGTLLTAATTLVLVAALAIGLTTWKVRSQAR
jgi:hypothetical protein